MVCQRCKEQSEVLNTSKFNKEIICDSCKDVEEFHDKNKKSREKSDKVFRENCLEAVRKGENIDMTDLITL